MTDYIKREDAIKAFDPRQRQDWYTPWIVETLNDLPPADVAPVRHERWVTTDENIGGHCSNCGMECSSVEWGDDYLMKPTWNYCPNCGARMDEEKDDDIR